MNPDGRCSDGLRSRMFMDNNKADLDARTFIRAKREGWIDDATHRAMRRRIAKMMETEGPDQLTFEQFEKMCGRVAQLEGVDIAWVRLQLEAEKNEQPSEMRVRIVYGNEE